MEGNLESLYATIATVIPVLMLGPLFMIGRAPGTPSRLLDFFSLSFSATFLMVFATLGCTAFGAALIGLYDPGKLGDNSRWINPLMILVVVYLAFFNMAVVLYPRVKGVLSFKAGEKSGTGRSKGAGAPKVQVRPRGTPTEPTRLLAERR